MAKAFGSEVVQIAALTEWRHGSVDPSAGGGVAAPIGSYYFQDGAATIWQKVGVGDTEWQYLLPRDFYGDGSDGDVVIGAGTTSIARNMYYNNLTIQNGGVLNAAGYRIWVRDTLTIEVGGTLRRNANDGAAGVGGSLAANISFGRGAGGGGGAGNAGAGSAGSTSQIAAGAGGAGTGGGGGAAGAGGAFSSTVTKMQMLLQQSIGCLNVPGGGTQSEFLGGAGGGGGGGDGAQVGGGGGGGGEGMYLFARRIINDGAIESRGGSGAAGTAADTGGGGGGGGGTIYGGYRGYQGNAPDVSGGSGGASGGGAGVAGAGGSAGTAAGLLET